MPPLGFVAARAGKKIGKGILHTAVGAAVISGLSHLFGVKKETEIIQTKGVTEMRLERNQNMVELNLAGASSVMAIIIIIMALVGICLCGKVKKILVKRKEEKEKKKEEEMEMKKKEKKKEVEKEEEEEEDLKMEDI